MKRIVCTAMIVALACGLAFGQTDKPETKKKAAPKYMCITFDDLPVARVDDRFDRIVVTDKILGALEEHEVKAAGFVIGSNIHEHFDLIEQWLEAGHTLGNHTYSHPDLNEVPITLYIQDIGRGAVEIEDLLVKYKQKKRYFRYPLLHYGDTFEKKKAVNDYIQEKKYIVAHVSIDNDEYIYNLQFEKLAETADSATIEQLGREYVEHILSQIKNAEKLADEVIGRKVNHILLLHANRLNARFLGDLLTAIEGEGYTFNSLDKALADPLYQMPDGYVGYKGLSIIERIAKSDPDFMPAREGK
ncbi:MAG: polysaccharide deacetylase family protein [Candidatus Zixiibacteriota bacterium]